MKYEEQRKQVDLPNETVDVLEKLAKEERNSLKGYMEKILIDHAKGKKSDPYPSENNNFPFIASSGT